MDTYQVTVTARFVNDEGQFEVCAIGNQYYEFDDIDTAIELANILLPWAQEWTANRPGLRATVHNARTMDLAYAATPDIAY